MAARDIPYVMNIANSIIGVSLLAMPFCFMRCGIFLGFILLLISAYLTSTSCELLMKAAIAAKRRSYEYLAYHVFGNSGKLCVEVGIVGSQLGVLIAFHVIVGDLGPVLISKWMDVENSDGLRTIVMIIMACFIAFPLSLMRNLDSLSKLSGVSLLFYFAVIVTVSGSSFPNLFHTRWMDVVDFWNTENMFQCLPIFAMAFGCQTQMFLLYDSLPDPTLSAVRRITNYGVQICMAGYLFTGFFGYIAFYKTELVGDVLLNFAPSIGSDLLKFGFVLSVPMSFPLMVFPCRSSLNTLLFPTTQSSHGHGGFAGPSPMSSTKFNGLTALIVIGTLLIGINFPNVEFILGLNGATMGCMIFFIFPAVLYLKVMDRNSEGTYKAKAVLLIGLLTLCVSTYSTLQQNQSGVESREETINKLSDDLLDTTIPTLKPIHIIEVEPKKPPEINKPLNIEEELPVPKKEESLADEPEEPKKEEKEQEERKEPPNPQPPDFTEPHHLDDDKKTKKEEEKKEVEKPDEPSVKANKEDEETKKGKRDEIKDEEKSKDTKREKKDADEDADHHHEIKQLLEQIGEQQKFQHELLEQNKLLLQGIKEKEGKALNLTAQQQAQVQVPAAQQSQQEQPGVQNIPAGNQQYQQLGQQNQQLGQQEQPGVQNLPGGNQQYQQQSQQGLPAVQNDGHGQAVGIPEQHYQHEQEKVDQPIQNKQDMQPSQNVAMNPPAQQQGGGQGETNPRNEIKQGEINAPQPPQSQSAYQQQGKVNQPVKDPSADTQNQVKQQQGEDQKIQPLAVNEEIGRKQDVQYPAQLQAEQQNAGNPAQNVPSQDQKSVNQGLNQPENAGQQVNVPESQQQKSQQSANLQAQNVEKHQVKQESQNVGQSARNQNQAQQDIQQPVDSQIVQQNHQPAPLANVPAQQSNNEQVIPTAKQVQQPVVPQSGDPKQAPVTHQPDLADNKFVEFHEKKLGEEEEKLKSFAKDADRLKKSLKDILEEKPAETDEGKNIQSEKQVMSENKDIKTQVDAEGGEMKAEDEKQEEVSPTSVAKINKQSIKEDI